MSTQKRLPGFEYPSSPAHESRIGPRNRISFLLATAFLAVSLIGCGTSAPNMNPPAPSITSLTPNSGVAGTPVTISGANFGTTQGGSTVTFSGTMAAPTSWSATSIVAAAPAGVTTGNVVVTVGGQVSNGMIFSVAAPPGPAITNVAPNPAAVGSSVTITGSNFGATQGTSTVKFNGTTAVPTSWSAASIVTLVPVGATSGNVVVTVGGQASNGFSFTVGTGPMPGDAVTWHYDNLRSGLNPNETVLTTANVKSATFGKVAEFAVDGQIDSQILYLNQVATPQGVKNVLYFATEHDIVYAVDADSVSGSTATILWSKTLVPTGEAPATLEAGCGNINPNGITATPVIDRARNAIYVVAMTMNTNTVTTQFDRIHALDLGTGNELFGGPTTIAATFPGTAGNIQNGVVTFDAKLHHERAALLESGGNIYTVWSGHNGDCNSYSAWVISFSADTLARTGVLDLSPDAVGGGMWLGGAGPSADAAGSIYVTTGNTFTGGNTLPANNYPNAVVRMSAAGGLHVADYFIPFNTITLNNMDRDLSSAAPMLLPDVMDNASVVHHLAVAAGKDGNLYVVNRDSLGQFTAGQNNIYQQFSINGTTNLNFSTPVFFSNKIYICPGNEGVKAFPIANALLATAPSTQSAHIFGGTGAAVSASSNGATNGIIWALDWAPGVLYAYDATNLSTLLYASNQAAGNRDSFAAVAGHFITPMVAKGRVYIGTGSTVAVFGLLP